MLKGQSPVSIHPNLDCNLYIWLISFMKNASKQRVKKTLALFQRYGAISMDVYYEMTNNDNMDFHFCHDGLLMIYTKEDTYEKKAKACINNKNYKILSKEETKKYMPFINDKIFGSVLLKQNGHLDPSLLMDELKNYLLKKGVQIIYEDVKKLEFNNNKITKAYTNKNIYEANKFILSTGHQILLSKQTNNDFLMTPAKGYSITFEMPDILKPKKAALFADLFIAMTPRKTTVRLTSKLELGTKNSNINQKQINSILNNFFQYSNDFEMKNKILWTGFRPLPSNDIPIIGYDKQYNNLIHATGLGWLGITLAPAIGKIINDLIIKEQYNEQNIDILLLSSFFQT